MKLLVLFLSALSCCAGVSPNALHIESSIPYRFSPLAYYSPGSPQNTLNGAGMSELVNLIPLASADTYLEQSTAASQPLLSRADNKGNLLLQSETLVSPWGPGEATFVGNKLVCNLTTGPHWAQQIASGVGTFRFEADLQAGEITWAYLSIVDSGINKGAWFDLFNGVIGSVEASITGATITSLGGGIYRCGITRASTANLAIAIWLAPSDTSVSIVGDGTAGFNIIKASLRQSSWDSDYIPTTTTPVYPGQNGQRVLVFDGVDDYMKSLSFPFVQPETVMGVFERMIYTAGGRMFGGNSATLSGDLYQNFVLSDTVQIYAGGAAVSTTDWQFNAPAVLTSVFNGASSSLTVNNLTPATGDAGASNMNGITVGAEQDGLEASQIRQSDLFLFDRVLTAPEQSCLVQWLGRRNGVNVW